MKVIHNDTVNSASKYMKKIKLDHRLYDAMIDPGSSDCTIKATAAIRGQFEINYSTSELIGFGEKGNVVQSPGTITANIKVDDVMGEKINIKIVPDHVQTVEVIIGRTYTELPNIVYYKHKDTLTFTTLLDNNIADLVARKPPESTLITADNNVIPPGHINFINVKNEQVELSLPVYHNSNHETNVKCGQQIEKGVLQVTDLPLAQSREEEIQTEEITVGNDINNRQKEELTQLVNEYRDCIAKNISELGKTDVLEMKIEEKPGSTPVVSKPYKVTIEDRQKIKEIVGDWKKVGIAQETQSSYASPVLLVRKKNGESRLVIDYRRLNAQTQRINFPLPNFDENLDLLYNAKMFVTLDLAHGYLQLPLEKDSRSKTAFVTPDETGELTRAMFGLMNSPFYFSKLMNTVLGPLRNKILLFYLDDILIPAENWVQLLARLRQVLQKLRQAGLTLNLTKCVFGKKSVEYLGYEVSPNGLSPGSHKVEAIRKFPTPKDLHEVRRFIGLASFFRRFVPKFSMIAEPLTRMNKKNEEFKWEKEQSESFELIKEKLTTPPTLQIYNREAKRTELHCDASSRGIAAILLQEGSDAQLRPVYAISRRTSDTEKAYHSSKSELLAVVWAIGRLRIFLLGMKFTVFTDCQALVYLHMHKNTNPQVVRWMVTLSEYDFEIKFRKGSQMQHVDALSRAPVDNNAHLGRINTICTREDEILVFQRSDNDVKRKIELLRKPNLRKAEMAEIKDYLLKDGLLYKKIDGKHLYVIPKHMRKAMTIKYHDLCSHHGLEKTLERMKTYYYFPSMRAYVKRHIQMCLECILSKHKTGKQEGLLNPIPPGKRPFEIIHMDHLGPFVATSRGYKYVLLIIDNLTKFVQIEAVKSTKTTPTIQKLSSFIDRFGAPNRIISDRGTCFTANAFAKFCDEHGIRHTLNASKHPQANGLVERLNRTILPMMISSVEHPECRDWDKQLKKIERDANTGINKTTGKSPFEVLYGYVPRFHDGSVRQLTADNETYRLPQELQQEVTASIEKEQQLYKTRYDKKRLEGVKYEIGDIVFQKSVKNATGESTKLQERYRGPYSVTRILSNDTYELMPLRNEKRRMVSSAHVSQLKLWKNRTETDDPTETNLPEDEEELDQIVDEEPKKVEQKHSESQPTEPSVRSRSQRQTKKPKFLDDYEEF